MMNIYNCRGMYMWNAGAGTRFKWVYGPTVDINGYPYILEHKKLDKPCTKPLPTIEDVFNVIPVCVGTVGFDTGFKDKRDKIIYSSPCCLMKEDEEFIVEDGIPNTYSVEFDSEQACFYLYCRLTGDRQPLNKETCKHYLVADFVPAQKKPVYEEE